MCLDKVTKIFKPNDRMKLGYKVYRAKSEKTFEGMVYHEKKVPYHLGGHYKATNETIECGNLVLYDSGFHCYEDIASAKVHMSVVNSVLVMVLAWDIRAMGYEVGNKHAFIAKNIRPMEIIESSYKPETHPHFMMRKRYSKEVKNIIKIVRMKDEKKSYDLFLKCLAGNFSSYSIYICLIDKMFDRSSREFLRVSKHHMKAWQTNNVYMRNYIDCIGQGDPNLHAKFIALTEEFQTYK